MKEFLLFLIFLALLGINSSIDKSQEIKLPLICNEQNK